ncbi:hypothetical protein ABT372_03390, partial [Streptomyces lydicus]
SPLPGPADRTKGRERGMQAAFLVAPQGTEQVVTALTDLPATARRPVEQLRTALAGDDAAGLVGPLAAVLPHLRRRHAALAARIEEFTRHTERVRQDSDDQRRAR